MTTLIFILSSVTFLSAVFFVFTLWTYIVAKKKSAMSSDDSQELIADTADLAAKSLSDDQKSLKQSAVLALLAQQQGIVDGLKKTCSEKDKLRSSLLDCWALFLDLEYKLVTKQVTSQEVDQQLEQFIPLTQEAGFSQMMASLVKKISAQRNLSQAINKDIERKNQLVLAKMGVNHELNIKFDRMKAELDEEPEVDRKLAEMRIKLVQAYQLESAIKSRLSSLKQSQDKVSEDYQLALELFLNSSDLDDFIAPLQSEFENKVEELKTIAEYQANTIKDLKLVVKESVDQQQLNKYKINYDIIVAKLEKSLSDKKQILSRLELKLESLQMVKYQLSKDVKLQDELVLVRDVELQQINQASESDVANMQTIFSKKEVSLNNMERQLDGAPLTEESQAYANELAEKITAFKLMMNESELFVEMLEFELESEQRKNADLQTRLAELSDYVMLQSMRVESIDPQDSIRLEEVNAELTLEIRAMKDEFEKSFNESEESILLQKRISSLDDEISQMKRQYAEMEDTFLSSLL
jgi:hypothetical protein